MNASVQTPKPPRMARAGSFALMAFAALALVGSALAPRSGAALAVFAPSQASRAALADWADARGGRIVGMTPLGGLVFDHAPEGALLAALRRGAIVAAVPAGLCTGRTGKR